MFKYYISIKQRTIYKQGTPIKLLTMVFKEKQEVSSRNMFFNYETVKQTSQKCQSCKFFLFCKKVKIEINNSRKENLKIFLKKIEENIREKLCEQKKLNVTIDEIDLSFTLEMEERI